MKSELIHHLEKLKYFKSVADSESFYRASLKLGISQPALTRSIQALEYVLDQKLMTRSPRGIKLTNEGTELLLLANDIFTRVQSWNIEQPKAKNLTQLKIGTYDNLATSLMPEIIKGLTAAGLHDIKLFTGASNSLLTTDLLEKKLDYILVAEPQRHRGVQYFEVAQEHYGFYASAEFVEQNAIKVNSVSPADLKKFRLLSIPQAIAGQNKTLDRLLWEMSLKNTKAEFNSFEVIKASMQQSLGIGLMPSFCVWRELRTKQVKQLMIRGVASKSLGRHKMYLCARAGGDPEGKLAIVEKFQTLASEIRG